MMEEIHQCFYSSEMLVETYKHSKAKDEVILKLLALILHKLSSEAQNLTNFLSSKNHRWRFHLSTKVSSNVRKQISRDFSKSRKT